MTSPFAATWSPGKGFLDRFKNSGPRGALIAEQLFEVGDKRIAEMDAAGIDMQVLSLNSPGVEQMEPADAIPCAHDANDFLADVVKRHPTRFTGFAALPYLHPTVPHKPVADALYGGFSPAVSGIFASSGWGWHIETATHLLRMVLGGVFDRHPKLQVGIGHMGEAIPFMLPRMNRNLPPQITKLARPFGDYLRQNVHYTFGGFNFMPTFLNLLLEVGVERIMFSADYPYGSMEEARTFLQHLPVSEADRERIAHGNAERVFKL